MATPRGALAHARADPPMLEKLPQTKTQTKRNSSLGTFPARHKNVSISSNLNGAPGTIRTSDPQIRSLMLYPAELRARFSRVAGCGPDQAVARKSWRRKHQQ